MSNVKVLYLGVYRDGTGWAHATQDYILALDSVDINVVPRPIKLNMSSPPIPKRLEELEKKDPRDCNIVIQHVLPHMMEYNGNFKKNIGLCFVETDSLGLTSWSEHLNLMDENWVCCWDNEDALERSKVTKPIKIVHVPSNIERFEQPHKPLQIPELQNKFVFYTIGEMTRRKNLEALLIAFHREFSRDEPVSLLIKGSVPGQSPAQAGATISELCKAIKINLKLHPDPKHYSQEVIITQELSEAEMLSLHATGDCFVTTSFGEAWCIPAFDAMAMGKTPICTNVGGMRDFIVDGGILVNGRFEPVTGMTHTFEDLNTAKENWVSIDVLELRHYMRKIYTHQRYREEKSQEGINDAYNFSYQNIGNRMKDLLNDM